MSYGPSITDSFRELGAYVRKILNGAKPADQPVLQATKFELVLNLRTAKVLGLSIPFQLQQLADEIIE
jgi:putative ABC transport system substrate-binding protein